MSIVQQAPPDGGIDAGVTMAWCGEAMNRQELEAANADRSRENTDLRRRLDRQAATIGVQDDLIKELRAEIAALRVEVEELRRAGHRQVGRLRRDPDKLTKEPKPPARATDRRELLSAVATRVRRIEPSARRSEISAVAQLLAGLVSPWEVIQAMFGEDILEHSTVYQEIIRRGEARGRAEGEARGRAQGEAQGQRQGAEALLLGVLESRFGKVPTQVRATLDRCPLDALLALAATAAAVPSIEAFGQAAMELAPPA